MRGVLLAAIAAAAAMWSLPQPAMAAVDTSLRADRIEQVHRKPSGYLAAASNNSKSATSPRSRTRTRGR